MEESAAHKVSVEERFSYDSINKDSFESKEERGYVTRFTPDNVFVALIGRGEVVNSYSWKMHVSLLENEQNIRQAWDAIVNILIHYKVHSAKVLRKGRLLQEYQKGKEITIYFQEDHIEWARMFEDIENALLENGVDPNYQAIGDKQVDGSQFLSCRQGENLLGIQSNTHNPSGIPHLFERLSVMSHLPKRVKIVRENEERVKFFYNQLEENYFEVLNEFRANFPYLLRKINIFSKIDESRIEESFHKYPPDVAQSISLGIKEIIFIGKEIERVRQEKGNLIETMNEQTYQLYLGKMLEKFERMNELLLRVLGILNENTSESEPSSGCFVIKEVTAGDSKQAPSHGSPRFVIEYSSVEESSAHSEDSSKAEESPRTSEDVGEESQPKRPGFRK